MSFIVLWFAALKPKAGAGEADAPAPAPAANAAPQSDAGAAKQLAERARDTASADAARAAATGGGAVTATGEATTAGSAAAAVAPGTGSAPAPPLSPAALKRLPAPVARALRERDVLVLLFHDGGRSADDRAVRRAVAHIGGERGRVRTHVAKLDAIARYAPLTRGAAVSQSPTVVVVDAQRKLETLVGFVDRGTIQQVVADAVRASRR